ncbi:MFS transporter [Alicyclobacillus vulcanalis]|uniref:MFS transporter, CP family, cyanate transporter n=1 Tax=Alicyclobacillus vulcanalis TaxID=252246 RepID=A0A1N7N3K4_9BACL|nr:MFS transporter [Alicyclobacillus vulcanalis]SIS92947.1 MFS transporter, CP family, cyanate transporter [Alicyclobacillus vulcanalis]
MGKALWLLALAVFVVSLDLRPPITSIGPLVLTIQHALHMNAAEVSLLTSIPVFCMGIFAPLTGAVASRLGMNRAILACVALVGAATLVRFFAHASWLLLVSAFAAGVGIAVCGPLLSGFIKHHFGDRAPSVIGLYSVGIGLGALASAALSIPLAQAFGAWQASLGAWTALAVLGLAAWLPILRRAPRAGEAPEQPPGAGQGAGSVSPWRSGRAWLLLAAFGLQSGIYYSTTTWLAPRAEETGYSASGAGVVLTVFALIQMFASLVLPMAMSRAQNRAPWLVACASFTAAGLIVCALPLGAWSAWLADALLGVGLGGLFPILLILPLDETTNGEDASRWTAMMQCGGYIISGVVPILAGAIKDATGNFAGSFWMLVALAILLVVCSLFLHKRRAKTWV